MTAGKMQAERIRDAIGFLKDGQSFKVGDLRLGMDNRTNMFVTGWSQYTDIKNLTKQGALQELEEIKELFSSMVDVSGDLKDFIQGKEIKYNLALDYGMGAIGICYEKGGIVKWEMDIK